MQPSEASRKEITKDKSNTKLWKVKCVAEKGSNKGKQQRKIFRIDHKSEVIGLAFMFMRLYENKRSNNIPFPDTADETFFKDDNTK